MHIKPTSRRAKARKAIILKILLISNKIKGIKIMMRGSATVRIATWFNRIPPRTLPAGRGGSSLGAIETRTAVHITSWVKATTRAHRSQTTMLIGFPPAPLKMLIISEIVKVSSNRIT